MNTTKIIERISKEHFGTIIAKYKNKIHVSPHALFPINNTQKDFYNEDMLTRTLLNEKPYDIGLQRNGRYSVFYKRKNGYLQLVVDVQKNRLEVVTFINPYTIPDLTRLK